MFYEELTQTLIPNATMLYGINDKDDIKIYRIYPNEGYKLHDKLRDWEEINFETNEVILHKGYTDSAVSCNIGYDFELNPREFFATLKEEVV